MQESFLNLLVRLKDLLFQGSLNLTGALLWGMILYLICLPLFFRKKEFPQNLCIAVLFLYTAALLQSCQCLTVPKSWNPDGPSIAAAFGAMEWNPFLFSSFGVSGLWTSLLSDFLVLMPIGFLVPMASFRVRFWKMILIALLCGTGLEAVQLLANILTQSASRSVSTGEAILSAAGCLTGYLIFSGLKKLPVIRHRARARHYTHPGQAV
ncbi:MULTISPECIES: VanZ family protein [Acutalibacteraceae]|uniref:VanZ family protein n=1 Tax=Acutalibacteraceae TaxID=3082771 RepID=UPI0013E8BCD6|nr:MULTISPECIES: VanZ family protein [Acutalibacteraceae]